ncbi:hypothetical protein SDC9_65759 [bioreactor metagenome]|uniref:Uncharacterized protein n=1 Tax=bioreactor metagenome TaxID=1076179 RepID=A0A644XSZ2_9ZZZZ
MKRRLKSFIIGFVLCLTVIAVAVGLSAVAGEALSALRTEEGDIQIEALGTWLEIPVGLIDGTKEAFLRIQRAAEYAAPPLSNTIKMTFKYCLDALQAPP